MTLISIEYQYTTAMARRATWRFLWRSGRKAIALAGVVFAIGVVRALFWTQDLLTVGFLLLPLIVVLSWYASIRRSMKLARELGDRRVVVTADDEGITFQSRERRSFTSWASLKEVWKLSDHWLFFPYGAGTGAYTAIPSEALTQDAIAFMSRQFITHATRVRT
jgi:hypothetical protein